MTQSQQEILRAIKIEKPYHARALVDGWLCIKYLDGSEESLSTFADVSKGDMILYGNATRSRPTPAPTDEQCRICSQAIAARAREQMLEELKSVMEDGIPDQQHTLDRVYIFIQKCESLKTSKEARR